LNPTKLCGDFIDTANIEIIDKLQLEIDIQIQCTAKALNQRDRKALSEFLYMATNPHI
jgi:hypothetical protein